METLQTDFTLVQDVLEYHENRKNHLCIRVLLESEEDLLDSVMAIFQVVSLDRLEMDKVHCVLSCKTANAPLFL